MTSIDSEETKFARSIRDCISLELTWVRPRALRRDYELRDGNVVVATLRFHSLFGSLATAACSDGRWTFKRRGFWRTEVSVRTVSAPAHDIAVFKNNTWSNGGTLELPDGRRMRASTTCWQSKYLLESPTGEVLLRFRGLGGLPLVKTRVTIEPAAVAVPELPWLVPLGYYLALMMESDSAAAGGASGSGG